MKLPESFKRMLDALAYANAGENLTLRQKNARLAGSAATTVVQGETRTPSAARLPQVGLYLGSNLPKDVMQYVMQTCGRLKRNLTVLSLQPENEVRALLAPYQAELDAAGIELRVAALTGEPLAALSQALRRRPEVAFLVCNESGYLGHGLLKGRLRTDSLPVPVVLVTGEGAAGQSVDRAQDAGRVA